MSASNEPRPRCRAAMFIQRGVPSDKQEEALLAYIASQRLSMLHRVPWWKPEDAVTLVQAGNVNVIVAAFDSRAVQQLAADIGHHGKVIVIHPEPRIVEPPRGRLGTLADLIVRWYRGGRSVQDIAADIGSEATDVRAVLRKHGEDPGRSH